MNTAPVILSALQYPEITCVCRAVNITAECDVCGAVVAAIHMPEVTHGFYCAEHCLCRTYSPSEEECRAMERNRALLKERQQKGAGPKPRTARRVGPTPQHVRPGKRPVNPARRAAALRQWGDPAARRKIVAGIRRGKRARLVSR
jgi:hypothetical protein